MPSQDARRSCPFTRGPRPGLYGIATNLIHNARRAERRQLGAYGRAGAISMDPPNEFDPVDSKVDAVAAAPHLMGAVFALPSGDRDALLLFAWAELSYQEVAIALGIPAGTVASRINRARHRMRTSLGVVDEPGDPKGAL